MSLLNAAMNGGAGGGAFLGETKTFAKGFPNPQGWIPRSEGTLLNKADYQNVPEQNPDGDREVTRLINVTTPPLNNTRYSKPVIAATAGSAFFVILKTSRERTKHYISIDGGSTFSVNGANGHYRCYPSTAQWFAPTGEFFCGYGTRGTNQPTGFMINPDPGSAYIMDGSEGHSVSQFSAIVGSRLYSCNNYTNRIQYTDNGRNWFSVSLPTGSIHVTGLAEGADGSLYVTCSNNQRVVTGSHTDYVIQVSPTGIVKEVHNSLGDNFKLLSSNIDSGGNLGGLAIDSSKRFHYVNMSASSKDSVQQLSGIYLPANENYNWGNYSQTCTSNAHLISWKDNLGIYRTISATPYGVRLLSSTISNNSGASTGRGFNHGEFIQVEHERDQTVRIRRSPSIFSYNTKTQFLLPAIPAQEGLSFMTNLGG